MMTSYWQDKILRMAYIDTDCTFYVGLSSTMPEADGSNVTEPNSDSYSRMPIEWSEPAGGVIENAERIAFPASSEEWFSSSAKAMCYVIFDGNTPESNVLGGGGLFAPMSVGENITLIINPGFLKITLTGELPE